MNLPAGCADHHDDGLSESNRPNKSSDAQFQRFLTQPLHSGRPPVGDLGITGSVNELNSTFLSGSSTFDIGLVGSNTDTTASIVSVSFSAAFDNALPSSRPFDSRTGESRFHEPAPVFLVGAMLITLNGDLGNERCFARYLALLPKKELDDSLRGVLLALFESSLRAERRAVRF